MPKKIIYLEKYSIAPSPSRDYYGLRVFQDEIKLFHWRISHGPHKSPLTENCDFIHWGNDKLLQSKIERVFGESFLENINDIVFKRNTLLTLPEKFIKKLLQYLSITDIVKLFSLSHAAYKIFNTEIVWESISNKRQNDNLIALDEKYNVTYEWNKFHEEMKDIRLQSESNKYSNSTMSSMTTFSQKDTSSYIKLSSKPQLLTIQTLSADNNIPEMNSNMNIKPRILDNLIKKSIKNEKNYAVNSVVDEVNGAKKNMLNIVNLQVDDSNKKSNTKQLKDIVDVRVSKKKFSDKTKIFDSTIPSKLNYSGLKIPNGITKLSKSITSNSKRNIIAISSTLKCNDIPPLDDLVKHTIDEFHETNKIFYQKFNRLTGTLSHEEHENFDRSPKKYDKSFLTNKYETTFRKPLFDSSGLTKNPELTLNYLPMKINELSTWQATKSKKLKSSKSLKYF